MGSLAVNGESAPIRKGDALPVFFNDVLSFENDGIADLEPMIIGIASQKFVLDTTMVKC